MTTDVIDALLARAHADTVVRHRAGAISGAERACRALFEPADEGGLPVQHRRVVAVAVAATLRSAAAVDWYAAGLPDELVRAATAQVSTGDVRLDAALSHARLLSVAPAQATSNDLSALSAAGYSPADIVTLSQLIGFLHFQLRVVAGLAALAASASSDGGRR